MFPPFKSVFFYAVTIQVLAAVNGEDYHVELSSNGPIIRGATIKFTAILYYGADLASGKYEFNWSDDAIPRHYTTITSDQPIVTWDVHYDGSYPPGPYEAQVIVKKYFLLIPYEITSKRMKFILSDTLNGDIQISQNNTIRNTKYVSTSNPLNNTIILKEPDALYISNATSITTYWFIDCIYYGPTNNGTFIHRFPISGEEHTIDALMVVDFTKPVTTTVPPTTTTIAPNVTTTTIAPNVTTTTKKSITTSIPSNTTSKSIHKRDANSKEKVQKILANVNGTLVPYDGSFPYVCNGTVAVDDKKSYGMFSRKIVAKAPISVVNVTGNNWLQHGDILTLNVLCDGAPSLRYCVYFKRGSYNATGNETCSVYLTLDTCSFLIQRYLGESMEHAVIIIIENDLSKVVKSVGVTVYKAKKQAQLSVIVVPVVFSLAAVVLIVFGVAYYIQNRRRFIVEVADFNFGVDYTNMEYKTFLERLQDSFINAFTRTPLHETSEAPNWPPGESQKYGSMD